MEGREGHVGAPPLSSSEMVQRPPNLSLRPGGPRRLSLEEGWGWPRVPGCGSLDPLSAPSHLRPLTFTLPQASNRNASAPQSSLQEAPGASFSLHPHLLGFLRQAWTCTSGARGARGCRAGPHPPTAPPPPTPHKCCWRPPWGCPGPWRRRLWARRAPGRWARRPWAAGPGGGAGRGSCRLRRAAAAWLAREAWAWAVGAAGEGGGGAWVAGRPAPPPQARPPPGPARCTSLRSPAPSFCVGAAGCSFLRTGPYWGDGSWLLLPESGSSAFKESPVGSGFCWERRRPEGRRGAGGRAVGGAALPGDQITPRGWQGHRNLACTGSPWRRERPGLGSSGHGQDPE